MLLLLVSMPFRNEFSYPLDNNVYRSAAAVVGETTQTEGLCDDTLTTEGGIAVKLDTKHTVTELALCGRRLEEVHLLGAGNAQGNGVDGLTVSVDLTGQRTSR